MYKITSERLAGICSLMHCSIVQHLMPVKAAKMGGCSSQEVQTVHSQLPVDQVPYQGPALQYAFVNVNTQMKSHLTFGFSKGENVVTSNVDEYYPYLAQNYNEGFKLIQFLKIPFNQSKDGVFSMSFNVPYQGIYCRKNAGQPEPNSWQLKIEKAMIHMQRLAGGLLFSPRQGLTHSQSDLAHMFHLIQTNASAGGRFVCMEQTGMVQSQGMSMAMSGVSPGRYPTTQAPWSRGGGYSPFPTFFKSRKNFSNIYNVFVFDQ